MFNNTIKRNVANPIVGLMPFLLYIILHTITISEQYALGISLLFSIVADIVIYRVLKTRMYSIIFYISTASLFLTLTLWVFTNQYIQGPNTYVIVCEILIALFFIILRMSRKYIVANIIKWKNSQQRFMAREFFHACILMQYSLMMHLIIILLDRQLRISIKGYNTPDSIIFFIIPTVIIIVLTTLEYLKVKSVTGKLEAEVWLPIVEANGSVVGKVAKSISIRAKNKYQHPVIRVMLVSNGKVYLQERNAKDILSPRKLDTPFEEYIRFGQDDTNLCAKELVENLLTKDNNQMKIDFLLKYIFENDDTKRLVLLYIGEVDDEHLIKREGNINGKFWTIKQIEEGFADEIFSECFELEFEYLKNMVLDKSNIHMS